MSASHHRVHRSGHGYLWSGLVGVVCVWMSLGCIVLEEGGDEVEPDRRQGSERPDAGGDEFEGFEDLDPSTPQPTTPTEPEEPEEPIRPAGDFEMSGSLSGGPEQSGELVVLWYVTTGEVPYFYKYGDGSLSPDGAWNVSVPDGEPPAEALNVDGVGVALVLGLDQWTGRMENGLLSRTEFRAMEQAAFGLSREHALVYIGEDATPLTTRTWAADFERDAMTCAVELSDEARGVSAMSCDGFELVVTREFGWLMF